MLDPIGAHLRLRDHYLSYLETAFRIQDERLSDQRRALLETSGTLMIDPLLEPVLRYQTAKSKLEDLIDKPNDNPLAPFPRSARIAFVELALSGLFAGDPDSGELRRKSRYAPYTHQMAILERGVSPGKPGIVTSGTGSGKTEAFMLPIMATIIAEAIRWSAPESGYLQGRWWESASPNNSFQLHRASEHVGRPKAVRALILYPMNALVEDQLSRLRKALDSQEARTVLDDRLRGNRIFFGRYTSATPVTGYRTHPRRPNDTKVKQRIRKKMRELHKAFNVITDAQTAARNFDVQAWLEYQQKGGMEPEATRFLFGSTDGAELVSRWDMQQTPPDILVTNISMLGTMLSREVDAPIFKSTRDWLRREEGSYFFLVLDELHLIRGSSGTEIAGLIRALINRLGLDDAQHQHKLRILGSSASLPLDNEGSQGAASLEYLRDFFGPFGTCAKPMDSGFNTSEFWRQCIIPGEPVTPTGGPRIIKSTPFEDLVDEVVTGTDFATEIHRSESLDDLLFAAADALGVPSRGPISVIAKRAVEGAAEALATACLDETSGRIRATSVTVIAERLFGKIGAQKALRGITILRGIGDQLNKLYDAELSESATSFRAHMFLRSVEGLFAAPVNAPQGLSFQGLSVERGTTYTETASIGHARPCCTDRSLGGEDWTVY
jgi:hypothetical protein